jgi:hypothetical protein
MSMLLFSALCVSACGGAVARGHLPLCPDVCAVSGVCDGHASCETPGGAGNESLTCTCDGQSWQCNEVFSCIDGGTDD